MSTDSPARERCYAAWAKTVPTGTDRAVFDSWLDAIKVSSRTLLRRRGGLGATFGALAAFTRCYDGPVLLAALQELLDAGEAAERATLYVGASGVTPEEHRKAYRVVVTPSEYSEIIHLIGTLRNAANT